MHLLLCRHEVSGNRELVESLSSWVFKRRGVLKVGAIEHFRKSDKTTPKAYTIMEDVVWKLITRILSLTDALIF